MRGPRDRPGVMLSAHSDVVPTEGQAWSHDPFRLTPEGDLLYGRGTTDMKGFLAAMLRIADRAAGTDLAEPLKLAISYDEEVGCLGIAEMLPHLDATIGAPRLCIVGEPTGMAIAHGHKGKAAYRVTCRGEAGHSAMAPRYVNALHLGADMLSVLRDLQQELARNGAQDDAYAVPYSTVHVGKMAGGHALNIVPDHCTLDFEIRHLAAEPLRPLADHVEAAAAARLSRLPSGTGIDITRINAYPGLEMDPAHPAVTLLSDWLENPGLTKVGFGTEAGHFSALGIPTLVCGPGLMDQGHIADEYVERAQLHMCDRMLERMLASCRTQADGQARA